MQLGGKSCKGYSNEISFLMWATAGAEGPPQRGGNLYTCSMQHEHVASWGAHVEGRHLCGCLNSGPAVKTLAHWFRAHWEPRLCCLCSLAKWKPINLKINLCLVQGSLVPKRISIPQRLKAKDTVSFLSFSSNTCFLAHRMLSECVSFVMPVPLEGKGPKHQEHAGQSLSLGGLRTVTHGVEELQHLITRVSLQCLSRGSDTTSGPRGILFLPSEAEARGHGR